MSQPESQAMAARVNELEQQLATATQHIARLELSHASKKQLLEGEVSSLQGTVKRLRAEIKTMRLQFSAPQTDAEHCGRCGKPLGPTGLFHTCTPNEWAREIEKQLSKASNDRDCNYELAVQISDEKCVLEKRLTAANQALKNVYEAWANSDGLRDPTTASKAYLLQLVEKMRDAARVVLTTNPGGDRFVSRMDGRALETSRRQAAQAVRETFKVGEFELCEPDYRQILRWAKALGREPDDVLNVLSSSGDCDDLLNTTFFRVEGGSIKELVWDNYRLPLDAFEWEAGLEIEALVVLSVGALPGMPSWSASQKLPSLRTLKVRELALTELDLSPVPGLEELECGGNHLAELDLSPVPGLTTLECEGNKLTELDLSPVPKLTELWCGLNQLTELSLSSVPRLTSLWCYSNQLTELDLTSVPELVQLRCNNNLLTELDLRPLDNLNISIGCDKEVRIIR